MRFTSALACLLVLAVSLVAAAPVGELLLALLSARAADKGSAQIFLGRCKPGQKTLCPTLKVSDRVPRRFEHIGNGKGSPGFDWSTQDSLRSG